MVGQEIKRLIQIWSKEILPMYVHAGVGTNSVQFPILLLPKRITSN